MKLMRDHKLIAALLILLVVLALLFTLSVTTGFGEGSFASFLNNGVSKITGFFSSAEMCIRDRPVRSGHRRYGDAGSDIP